MKPRNDGVKEVTSGTLHIDDFLDYLSVKYEQGTRYVLITSDENDKMTIQLLPELMYRKYRR